MEYPPESLPASLSLREPRARARFNPQIASLLMMQTVTIRALKPDADAKAQAKNAEKQAKDDPGG